MIDDHVYLNLTLTRKEHYILQEHNAEHQLLVESPEDDHFQKTGFEQEGRRCYVVCRTHASVRLSSRIQGKHPRGEDRMTRTMKAYDRWELSTHTNLLLAVVAILFRPITRKYSYYLNVWNLYNQSLTSSSC